MATVTHYIYSRYDPAEREALEQETGQAEVDTLDPEEAWQREASRLSQRKRTAPPKFVSATIPVDEWGTPQLELSKPQAPTNSPGSSVSGWYRSLTRASPRQGTHSSTSLNSSSPPSMRKPETRNKNNWFIMKAIESEPPSSYSVSAPSLADILARDPPPLPSEGRYIPPVWLEIGPSNKGFGMLQRSGWNEGEPLGADVIRRKAADDPLHDMELLLPASTNKGKRKSRSTFSTLPSRKETVEIKVENFDDVSELRNIDVIDLTLSDSEEDGELDPGAEVGSKCEQRSTCRDISSPSSKDAAHGHTSYERKALLTPIATVLKSDRLGIGLKAKTVGPYRTSQKRVTHNAAALSAHVKAAEESRKRKKLFGRGHRGFQKQRNREEENRKAMTAHLKGL